MNFREIAEKAGMAKFYFQDGKQADALYLVGKDFVEKFGQLILEKMKDQK